MPILHMRLYTDDMLRGGISLVFSNNQLSEQVDYAALVRFVHLVIDSGLDGRQLRITRRRLEQVNLIAQVSQALNGTLDLEAVLQETTELTADVLQAQAATLFLTDERRNQLIFYVPSAINCNF